MNLHRTLATTLAALGLGVLAGVGPLASPALAARPTSVIPISASSISVSPPAGAATRSSHASLHLEIGHAKAWLGQSLPVTLRAYFRNVEGVTLEGAPQITSAGVFTSELSHEPHQSTEIVGGEPVLVATWTGTLTPSAAGPLALSGELPVRVRYRDVAPSPPRPAMDEDAFQALAANPFDSAALDRFFEGATAPQGRVHEEVATLRSAAPTLDVLPLPTDDRPATFTGAVGRFGLQASLSAPTARVSEPLTLRVTVDGSGDFDRVDLHGVDSSDTWKTYPMSAKSEPTTDGKAPHRKVFEQVLVPLRGGEQTVPPLTLASFDPKTGHYETQSTTPVTVPVEGVAAPVTTPSTPASDAPQTEARRLATNASSANEDSREASAFAAPSSVHPYIVALSVTPAFALLTVFAAATALRKRRAARALAQKMRSAAAGGTVAPFYQAARDLIASRLSEKWGIAPSEVTTDVIHQRLGLAGDPLVEAFATDEALRFGRATVQMEHSDLRPLCASIERSLGSVSSLGGVS